MMTHQTQCTLQHFQHHFTSTLSATKNLKNRKNIKLLSCLMTSLFMSSHGVVTYLNR